MKKIEKFELGKTYIHSSGKKMKIVGIADTVIYGLALVGEDEHGHLTPVQIDCIKHPEALTGWDIFDD